jgi:hypothetical protein
LVDFETAEPNCLPENLEDEMAALKAKLGEVGQLEDVEEENGALARSLETGSELGAGSE